MPEYKIIVIAAEQELAMKLTESNVPEYFVELI